MRDCFFEYIHNRSRELAVTMSITLSKRKFNAGAADTLSAGCDHDMSVGETTLIRGFRQKKLKLAATGQCEIHDRV